MKNTIVKISLTVVCLLSNLLIFAAPGDESDTGDLQSDDNLPINSQLIFLVLAGILLAVYTFKRNRKMA